MKRYLKADPWKIIEEGFNPDNNLLSESIFSLGNGYMGQRANFEEKYSGDTLQGSYMAGVYYPDKTIVGWWKIGYPEYYAKVLNSTNWIGIDVKIEGHELDLANCRVSNFIRSLDMKEGHLSRRFIAELADGKKIEVDTQRFLSMRRGELGVIRYSICPINFSGKVELTPYLDGDIINQDANYGEKFWEELVSETGEFEAYLQMKTKKLNFHISSYMRFHLEIVGQENDFQIEKSRKEKYVANKVSSRLNEGNKISLYKYVANCSSRYYHSEELIDYARRISKQAYYMGYKCLLEEQREYWKEKWRNSDIIIEGDTEAQQGIRFNIFQLNQTYTGEDASLNIGPKGFTGEKYGGSTYWDTEAYCLPFYLGTADNSVARNLLLYRYQHLEKAIENAEKLGFENSAALYPMVTMNGEESHNEWEITFEEIHRNGAIAYAIYNYVNYTGDKRYLGEYGLEVLLSISRFWAQRVNYSSEKNKYVILGVTGPNEYENNVNNNWYTNKIAVWTLEYTLEVIDYLKKENDDRLNELVAKLSLAKEELEKWQDIINNIYYPYNEEREIFL
ncbi:MAG: glycoside hydrolase family 65 protein, partial [Halanaerobiales bacterium]